MCKTMNNGDDASSLSLCVVPEQKKKQKKPTQTQRNICANPTLIASDKAARRTKHMNHRNKFMRSNKMFETVTTNTRPARGADLMPAV